MCGIAGIYDVQIGREIELDTLKSMINILHHRGPDGVGFKRYDCVGLGHARLSIIDLEHGEQPMHNKDNSICVVFNGEIFNYIELKAELINKGYHFTTRSDTEVLVHLYQEYGEGFVKYLNGQFAIAVYDDRIKKLLLVRDRVGITPLFYTQINSRFYFASEIKSILAGTKKQPSINFNALDQIFTFWAPLSPETMFKDIFEVSPGQMLSIQHGKVTKTTYWEWEFPVDNDYLSGTDDELANQLKELLIDATRIRLRADVPVGAYLSGGIDSSTIVSLLHNYTSNPLRTFSIGFDDGNFDETTHQNSMLKKYPTNHSYIKISNHEIADGFVDTIWHTESVMLRTAPIPMKRLSGLVKRNQYKVVLTGEGADEILGGYDIFKEAKIRRFWAINPRSSFRSGLLKRLYPYLDMSKGDYLNAFFGQGLDKQEHYAFSHFTRWSSTAKCKMFFSKNTNQNISRSAIDDMGASLPKAFTFWHPQNQAGYLEAKSLMGGYLLSSQGDRMLMSNSVEGRFPFLDHRVIEFANKLHPKTKLRALNEKYILKKAMKNDLPESILDRSKQPYRAPSVPNIFSQNSKFGEHMSSDKISEYGYFDVNKIKRLINKVEKGRPLGNTDNMSLIGVLSTQVWHKHFIEDFNVNFLNT